MKTKVDNGSLLTKNKERIEVHVLEVVGFVVSDGFPSQNAL